MTLPPTGQGVDTGMTERGLWLAGAPDRVDLATFTELLKARLLSAV